MVSCSVTRTANVPTTTWSDHIYTVFTKCLKLSFFIHRLRPMNIHKSLLWGIESASAIPVILYSCPIAQQGLYFY